ncbi:MAG: hypothetical protein O3B31_07330, partial [Chloroflexi bacterium]|nr:hypothetical protein [Chloroflexota bacterium]
GGTTGAAKAMAAALWDCLRSSDPLERKSVVLGVVLPIVEFGMFRTGYSMSDLPRITGYAASAALLWDQEPPTASLG